MVVADGTHRQHITYYKRLKTEVISGNSILWGDNSPLGL